MDISKILHLIEFQLEAIIQIIFQFIFYMKHRYFFIIKVFNVGLQQYKI